MHQVQAVYGQRWLAPTVLVAGATLVIAGIVVHGEGGSDLRSGGLAIICVCLARIIHLASLEHLRVAYRFGLRKQRRQLVVALSRRDDDKVSTR